MCKNLDIDPKTCPLCGKPVQKGSQWNKEDLICPDFPKECGWYLMAEARKLAYLYKEDAELGTTLGEICMGMAFQDWEDLGEIAAAREALAKRMAEDCGN